MRLGLSAAVAAPLGNDLPGIFVRQTLEEEGITVPELTGDPHAGDRGHAGGRRALDGDRGPGRPRPPQRPRGDRAAGRGGQSGVRLDRAPSGPYTYVTCGDDDARAFAQRIPNRLAGARALFVNRREASVLTGADKPEEAARLLAEVAETVVVTLGPDGAFGMVEGEAVSVAGEPTGRVIDATGAGDLFAAAYTWADLLGAEPEARMRWANLYAALSVTAPTGVGGAVTRAKLEEEAEIRGLPPLPAS